MHSLSEGLVRSLAASLPTELLLDILEYAWDRKRQGQITLAHCSLVCSSWRPIAQTLLFTEVVLGYEPEAENFLKTIQDSPQLGRATKILSFEEATMLSYESRSDLTHQSCLVWNITRLCPHLYHLYLEVPYYVNGEVLRTLLHPRTSATLQSFHLTIQEPRGDYPAHVRFIDIFRLFQQFLALSHLRVENPYVVAENALTFPHSTLRSSPPPSFKLYEFGWINPGWDTVVSIDDGFMDITDWLFRAPGGGPYIFELQERNSVHEIDVFDYFMSKHAQNLHSIRSAIDEYDFPKPSQIFYSRLQELDLPNVRIYLPKVRSCSPFPHLQHLGLGEDVANTMDTKEAMAFIDWVISLPQIRCVSYYLSHSHEEVDPNDPLFRLWKERCSDAIELKLVPSDEVDVKDDFIRTTHFPRRRTISNLCRMTLPST
ncbi:hypothetical protein FRC03_000450 [Tulasnella sp. 419]|nr:hypothetical protein FRC03_000450 [Tulasnella sp. 419]